MTVLVTGATGYIGKALTGKLLAGGLRVVAASRHAAEGDTDRIAFDLSAPDATRLPDDTEIVVHLACSTTSALSSETEQAAARHLLDECRRTNARFLFISSQTARPDAPSPYGRTKFAIEDMVKSRQGIILRPGQVYGGEEKALFGQLVAMVRRLRILPALLPAPRIQPVLLDDLTTAIAAIVETPQIRSGTYRIASPDPVSFTDFLKAIAERRLGRTILLVPFPAYLVRLASRLDAFLPGAARAPLKRLASLLDLPVMETEQDLRELNLSLRPFPFGMDRGRASNRKPLLREGYALLAYLLKERPSPGLIRRYVRAIETIDDASPLPLPGFAISLPGMIALFENQCTDETGLRLNRRLDTALRIAEASPQGARRFLLLPGRKAPARALIRMAIACLAEAAFRILSLVARPRLAQTRQEDR